MTRNADAGAELFTDDGVIEAPLLTGDKLFPRRMQGRAEIRGEAGRVLPAISGTPAGP